MLKSVEAQIVADSITGQLAAADAPTKDEDHLIFLNHCGYDKLSCGGVVGGYNCASVLVIRELATQFKSRWWDF